MNKVTVLLVATLLAVASMHAQGDKWAALPNENCWQWMNRVHLCSGCGGHPDALAFVDWSDATPPRYVDLELAPDEPLLTSHPFGEPSPSEQFFDYRLSLWRELPR